MTNPFDLKGKSVLITGASSGMGEEAARALAAAGAELAIVGRNAERLEANRATSEKAGGTVHSIVQDITEEGAPDRIVEQARTEFPRVEAAFEGMTLEL